MVRVEDGEAVGDEDVLRVDGARALLVDANLVGLRRCRLEDDFLQVEDDVGHVLDDVADGRELVERALELDGRDGRALERGEEHAAERVADGMAITGFEGFGDELGVGGRSAFLDFGELAGKFELTETFGHDGLSG